MKTKNYFPASLVSLSAFALLFLTVSAFTAKVGLDSYEIYLDDKLILGQYVNQPLNLRKLPLDQANANDQLRIYYKHCHEPGVGTGRGLTIKDQKGNTLKQWKFADVTGKDKGMTIQVKELLALEKSHANSDLSLHYMAQQLPKGEMLASLHFSRKDMAAGYQKSDN